MNYIYLFIFMLCFCSLNSCKEKSEAVDPSLAIEKLKPKYYLGNKFLSIHFANSDKSHNLIGIGKNLLNDKSQITQVIYSNKQISLFYNIKIDNNSLIESVQVLTPESNREVRFSGYRLVDKKVTIEVVDLLANTSIVKGEVDLTNEETNTLISLQTKGKSLANGRAASPDCNAFSGAAKSFFLLGYVCPNRLACQWLKKYVLELKQAYRLNYINILLCVPGLGK